MRQAMCGAMRLAMRDARQATGDASTYDERSAAVRGFDLHLHDAWKGEIDRLGQNGDVVSLVMMQECGPDILYDDGWNGRMAGMIASACCDQSLREESDRRDRVKDLLCGILGEQWVEAQRNALASVRRALLREFQAVPDGALVAAEASELASLEKIDLEAQRRYRIATNLLRRFEMRKRKRRTCELQ